MSETYACGVCGETYVVPALARACEDKHLDEHLAQP